jgi:hypothetical protein
MFACGTFASLHYPLPNMCVMVKTPDYVTHAHQRRGDSGLGSNAPVALVKQSPPQRACYSSFNFAVMIQGRVSCDVLCVP